MPRGAFRCQRSGNIQSVLMLRAALMLLLADVLLFGRETPLEKLQHEAVRLRRPHGEKGPGEEVEGREALHRALREWIESQLPRNKAELAGEPARLNSKLQDELEKAGMTPPDVPETPEMIGDWCRHDEACGDLREAQAPIDAYANAARLAELAGTVFDRWCGLLGGAGMDRAPK